MKALSGDELVGINQQAATVAASVLSEAVVAATLTQSIVAFEKTINRRSRWFGRGATEQNAYDNRIMSAEVWLASGGLPDSFILAVTAGSIYVIEDKRKDTQLFAGQVLKSWVRNGFRASVDRRPLRSAVPADCQMLRLVLPIEPVKNRAMNRQLQKAAEMAAARGWPPGAEHGFVVGRDAATEGVIKALTQSSAGAAPTVTIAGQDAGHVAGGVSPQASSATAASVEPSTANRLQELESLRTTGVISDAEYTVRRAQIIGEI